MRTFGVVETCQNCESRSLRTVLFLGYLPAVNSLRSIGKNAAEETTYPAEMVFCEQCALAQLRYAVPSEILFPPEYPYTSGTTRILRDNFAELADEAAPLIGLQSKDLVVDVGSNDGTLLKAFARKGYPVAGIEPSLTAKLAESAGIPTVMRYFDAAGVAELHKKHGKPKLVTATNVFAHILDVHEVIRNISTLLADDGVFISESHYLGDLVETLQYDTIYHEHVRYYSLTALKNLLATHGYRVFHVKRIPTHGGSIRVYASRSSRFTENSSVNVLLNAEASGGVATSAWIPDFQQRVVRSKLDFYSLVAEIRNKGEAIYGVGAPSRASTLITYLGLDEGILECVVEVKESLKVDKYIPGRRIPIVDEARLFENQPPYALMLSWHIADELCPKLKALGYRGDFLIPLPKPRIIRNQTLK